MYLTGYQIEELDLDDGTWRLCARQIATLRAQTNAGITFAQVPRIASDVSSRTDTTQKWSDVSSKTD